MHNIGRLGVRGAMLETSNGRTSETIFRRQGLTRAVRIFAGRCVALRYVASDAINSRQKQRHHSLYETSGRQNVRI